MYFLRIREDILKSTDPGRNVNWDLPPNIRPEDGNAGLPTRNLLGWKPSVRMKEDQLHFLYDCGFDAQGVCTFQLPRFPINMDLLLSIQQEINNLKIETRQTGNLPTGSQAQLIKIKPLGRDEDPALEQELIAASPTKIAPSLELCGGALMYRVEKLVSRRLNNWCIYNFRNYRAVPEQWRRTANTFRQLESPILQVEEFGSAGYLAEQFTTMYLDITTKNRI